MMKPRQSISARLFFLLVVPLSLMVFSCTKDEVEPEAEFTYAGDYNGFWRTTYEANGFSRLVEDQVSATFTEIEENIFIGLFYYSNNWQSCCGAEYDGEISFELEGDSLVNLIFNQDFRSLGFQTLSCPAVFTGEGVINEDGNLAYKIAGNDCVGSHEGTLLLRKQDN